MPELTIRWTTLMTALLVAGYTLIALATWATQ